MRPAALPVAGGLSLSWLRWASLLLGLVVALSLPALRLAFGLEGLRATLEAESTQLAAALAPRVSINPEGWSYENNALLSELRQMNMRRPSFSARVLDAQGRSVAELGDWSKDRWLNSRTPLYDSGVVVGEVEVQVPLTELAFSVAAVALLGLLLAAGLWLIANHAVRALERSLKDIEAARAEAEAANRAKSLFLATMSHEIRTPMNGVLGMAELLAQSELSASQAQSLQTIRDSAQALLRVIDDILDFSKIEAGRLELEQEPTSLEPLLDSLFDALSPIAGSRGVRLHLALDPKLPTQVLGDAVRLRQVLTNLLGNAIKFSANQADGRVQLRVQSDGSDGLVFEVVDNGIGIPLEAQGRLFQAFSQAESSTTRRFGGTGLGLAITHRLVLLMQGSIELRSSEGQGACFSVRLPLPTVHDAPPMETPDLHGVRVLLQREGAPWADDAARWLQAAGAELLTRPPDQTASAAPSGVVLVGQDPEQAARWPERAVLVSEGGRRRGPRQIDARITQLDQPRRLHLLRAVAMAAGRASPAPAPAQAEAVPPAAVNPPTVAEAAAQGRLILVAEDDPTNRTVIARQLAWLGYAAEMAENGALALLRWREGRFALLLTDLHMPELDGFALTRALRADEAAHGLPRRPMLALTANALRGEDQRALDAGLDDYLTKPLPIRQLQAALARWLPVPKGLEPQAPLLSLNHLRELVGEDVEFERELLRGYLQNLASSLERLRETLQSGDLPALSALTHQMKGAARSVGALRAAQALADAEQAARDPQASRLAAGGDQLLDTLQQTHTALQRHLDPAMP